MNSIPIEALLEAREAGSPRYLISYAPSGNSVRLASRAPRARGRPAAPAPLLALGDPVPAPPEEVKPAPLPLRPAHQEVALRPRPSAPVIDASREVEAVLRGSRGVWFEPLPGSRREVQAIAGLFGQSTVHLGSDASEQSLESLRVSGRLSEFAVIHLATHGRIDDLTPMNSRLLLSQDLLADPVACPSPDRPCCDGILLAGEVMDSWRLNAELVTLSACRSGLGRLSGGEGFVGFPQAFFLAGARSLLVSLWEVDDRATALLMIRFYQDWLGEALAWHGRFVRPRRFRRPRPGCGTSPPRTSSANSARYHVVRSAPARSNRRLVDHSHIPTTGPASS